jgi:hypothetical protein
LLAVIACAPAPPVPVPLPVAAPAPVFGEWTPLSFGSYLAPTTDVVAKDGSVELIWHFHACRAADKDWRSLDANVVIVCINNLGMGTAPYWDAFNDPTRFGRLEDEVMKAVGAQSVRRTTLVAWSAGYASVQQILAVPRYYDEASAVVLLDALHAGYVTGGKAPNIDTVGPILRFADDAAHGKKTFVFTHSAVVPPDYASTTEMAAALELRLKMTRSPTDEDFPGAIDVADLSGAHIRGFEGREAKDHIGQLHWLTRALTKWVLVKR